MAEHAVADPHAGETDAHEHPRGLAHHFEDIGQQREAAQLGMWLFLVTEFMFFGGLFLTYVLYRHLYPEGFALVSHHRRNGRAHATWLPARSLSTKLPSMRQVFSVTR